jgi:biotin-dependent carboxylase-like uncharacterized protein
MSRHELLEIIEPGLLTTIQDVGRAGLTADGVTAGGAADTWSLGVANALVGNAPGAAALELTLAGPTLRAIERVTVGLAGTIAGRVVGAGAQVAPGTSVTLQRGETLRIDAATTGARGYLAVPGGIDVPVVLGSRSTALGAAFGGLEGRALRAGDRIGSAATGEALEPPPTRWPGAPAPPSGPIRVLPGPHAHLLGGAALEALVTTDWSVESASDRIGLRLHGPGLPGAETPELATMGVLAGAIQVPRDRRPIVLLADHQPTGGYPVVAVAIRADLPALGQVAPGTSLRFERTTMGEARDALAAARRAFDEALAAMHDEGRWDELWRWARG